VRVTNSNYIDDNSYWSPDGKKIAFSRYYPDNHKRIFMINVDGSGITDLSNRDGWEDTPSWPADETKIAFTSDINSMVTGNFGIYTMNGYGTGRQRLTTTTTQLNYFPIWSR